VNEEGITKAASDRVKHIQDAVKEREDGEKRVADETERNEKETAKIRHDAALDAMDDEHKLQALIKERGEVIKKYTGDQTPLEKSELDKSLALKDAQIQGLRNSIAGSGSSSGTPPPPSPPPGTLASSAALEDFKKDPNNYNADGSMKAGALGRQRWLERKAERDSAVEARRQQRGFGSTPSPQQPAAAAALADPMNPGFWKNPAIKQEGVSTGKQFGPWMPNKADIMGDGSKGGAGAGGGDKGNDKSAGVLGDIKSILDKRLPKKTTGKG
jgi:hypothetical protein